MGGATTPVDPAGHYSALGLKLAPGSPGPSDDEIKGAYRRLVLELHPDKQAGKGAGAQKKARGVCRGGG